MCCAAGLTVLASALAMSAVAEAAQLRPHWAIISTSAPRYFKTGDEGDYYEIIAVNDGGAPTDGSAFKVTDALPSGVTPTAIFGEAVTGLHGLLATTMGCSTLDSCESTAIVPVGEMVSVKVLVTVTAEAPSEFEGSVTITGGGAESATAVQTTTVSSETVPFGASAATDIAAEKGYDNQAASHPVGFTTMLAMNVASVSPTAECTLIGNRVPGCPHLNSEVKDLEVALPPGLLGDPTVVPRCSQTVFQTYGNASCPSDTQVGILHLAFYGSGTALQYTPVYNVEPPPGQPAELGFTVGGFFHIPMYFHVRSDGDYGLDAEFSNISEADPVRVAALTIWGVPASASHDPQREGPEASGCGIEGCSSNVEAKPFLRLPTSCTSSEMKMSITGDSWQHPGTLGNLPLLSVMGIPAMTGCEALPFDPSLAVAPDTLLAAAPASYSVKLSSPQNEDPEGLASPDVRNVELTLPEGTVLSPSAANGLSACSEHQFELHSRVPGNCPPEAKIGHVEITTPLLEAPLHGGVFLGTPECRPCTPEDARAGRMAPVLIEAEGFGVVVKLAGHTRVDQATGRLTTAFAESPQLPFSDVEVTLDGGPNAPLVNPKSCGGAVAMAKLTPWSAMTAVETAAPPIPISGCSTPGFSPSLRAGTVNAQAGAFGALSVSVSRPEGQQDLGSVAIHTPPGLLGMISNVALCGEAQANAGTCPAASEIGIASATVGPGSQPLKITGGRVYLTGPYEGKPFGLSIVTPTEAGPFQLVGNTGGATEVIRASIAVDPHTAAVSVASGAFPSQLEGIPLDIRRVDVNINRPDFMFNPTNCGVLSIAGTVRSTAGMSADVSVPFKAVNCATLPFSPKFTVSTSAKTSKARGASLHVKVTSRRGQANIGKVKVDLPRQLPSRLATLQKACLAAVFDANPANCPTGSVVGTSKAVTPVLNGPLRGPAYLVSHGGASFPDLEIVLQGQGITLVLDGNTRIKKGVTSSIFNSVPDAPISTFDLDLPEGPHSVLAANLPARAGHSMCGQRLLMPLSLTGQNGAVVRKTIRVSVSGCSKTGHRTRTR